MGHSHVRLAPVRPSIGDRRQPPVAIRPWPVPPAEMSPGPCDREPDPDVLRLADPVPEEVDPPTWSLVEPEIAVEPEPTDAPWSPDDP